MDGPAVNWKFYDLLQQDLTKEYNIQCLTLGTCGLHILNNAFKHRMSSTGWDIPSFLSSLYWIFKDSPARREDFLSISGLKKLPVKFCFYRWLQNVPAVERAIEIWDDLLLYIKEVEMGKFKKNSSKSFSNILEATKDKTFLIKLNFFLSLSKILLPFLEYYQSDKPLIPFFAEDILKLVNDCLQHFKILKLEYSKITKAENLYKFNFNDPNCYNDKSKVYLGFIAEQLMNDKCLKKDISQAESFALKQEGQQCVLTMVQHLMSKCPINYSLIRNASCIDPRLMVKSPEKAQNKMNIVLTVLMRNKRVLQDDCDEILLQFGEFLDKVVKTNLHEFSTFDPQNLSLDTFLTSYFHDFHYSKVWKIVKMILILSHGQASVERGFSVNKAIEIENLSDSSYIFQCTVFDYIKFSGGVLNIEINKEMRSAAASARSGVRYLEEQKSLTKSENSKRKRNILRKKLII